MSRGESNLSRWLEAYSERNTNITTFSGNCTLADVAGDGNYHLVIGDIKIEKDTRSKLRIYKGTTANDLPLPNVPSSVISFYTDSVEPRLPAVGVACDSTLYVHKNNKPYFKFQIPPLPINPTEDDLWKDISNKGATSENIKHLIKNLGYIPPICLSTRSQELLVYPRKNVTEDFVKSLLEKPLRKCSPITCMTTLKKNSQDTYDISCPVLATEIGNIYILDPQTFTVLHQANANRINCSPFKMEATGIFNVEFRIIIACREGYICVLRRGWLEGKSIIQIIENIVDILVVPGDNLIQVATTDQILTCYTKRGNKVGSMTMLHPIVCLCLIPLSHLSVNLIAVGMKNGLIQLYHGRKCVDQTTVPGAPSAILFGQLGQEEHVLVIITIGGTIIFRILKRTADFSLNAEDNVPHIQNRPLPLPKRSKLFLEQSMRERQNAVEIHRTFQEDLVRLRLNAARELVKQNSTNSDILSQKERLKLSAQVLGLGPKFTVIFTLENMEDAKVLYDLLVVLHISPSFYVCSSNILQVPLLQAGFSYKMQVLVEEVSESLPDANPIRVFVLRKTETVPILTATVMMPPTEFPFV